MNPLLTLLTSFLVLATRAALHAADTPGLATAVGLPSASDW